MNQPITVCSITALPRENDLEMCNSLPQRPEDDCSFPPMSKYILQPTLPNFTPYLVVSGAGGSSTCVRPAR